MRCTQSVVSAAAGKASLQVELGAVGGEVELPLCHSGAGLTLSGSQGVIL